MIPVAKMKWIKPEAELMRHFGEMDGDSINEFQVMTGDQILAVLGRDDVISFFENLERTDP